MSGAINLHWYLPTHGDGRTLLLANDNQTVNAHGWAGDQRAGQRPATLEYLGQVARAAEQAGFDAALTPTGTSCDDAWITTAALSQIARRLRFLVAFRPGSIAPTLAAQQAASFQFHTGGRLALNIVTGGEELEQRRYGDGLDKDGRYERTDEFLTILRGIWEHDGFSFHGRHLWAEDARAMPIGKRPPIFFGGSSPAGQRVAARHADVWLTWGEPPEQVAANLQRVGELAAANDRELSFGIRLHVVSRDSSEAAWAAAERLLDGASDEVIAEAQQRLASATAVGQQRMVALHGGRRDRLEIHPNLWAGVGLLRGGAGTALVGSHEEVADRIAEYHAVGITHFIFSGYPGVEEAYHFGEGVRPILAERGLIGDHVYA